MKPVIYLTEPIGVDGEHEATETLFYCSGVCRVNATLKMKADSDDPIQWGMSEDWIPDTVCDHCGVEL